MVRIVDCELMESNAHAYSIISARIWVTRIRIEWFQTGLLPDTTERSGEQQQRFDSTRGDVRGSGRHDRRRSHTSFTS